MSAQEFWCLLALVAAVASAGLFAVAPAVLGTWPSRASHALLAAAVACLAAGLLVAL